MKKTILSIFIISFFLLVLSGCSLNQSSEEIKAQNIEALIYEFRMNLWECEDDICSYNTEFGLYEYNVNLNKISYIYDDTDPDVSFARDYRMIIKVTIDLNYGTSFVSTTLTFNSGEIFKTSLSGNYFTGEFSCSADDVNEENCYTSTLSDIYDFVLEVVYDAELTLQDLQKY